MASIRLNLFTLYGREPNSARYIIRRLLSCKSQRLDWDYLCDINNRSIIKHNINKRKGVGDIDLVLNLYNEIRNTPSDRLTKLSEDKLLKEALRIPNKSHPKLLEYDNTPKVIKKFGPKRDFEFTPIAFENLSNQWSLTRTDTSVYTGSRSYYLLGQLADLEKALINYSLDFLLHKGFQLVSVPDILPRDVIEDCGMDTRGVRSQVYALDGHLSTNDLCLSGTAEMGISYYLKDKVFNSSELPCRIAAVSRCYRAETSKIAEEKGIYRVHQFTKVEMYGVYSPDQSEAGLEEFKDIQEEFFSSLDLECQILDMPECELGAQAYRKFDVEAYLPGRKMWGELSSTSDCTDYQSRRLNIVYDSGKFAHTVNGTACAIPRTIVAIMETHQCRDGSVVLPKGLVPYLGYDRISNTVLPKILPFKPKVKVDRGKQIKSGDA